jgi:hypothetical protein
LKPGPELRIAITPPIIIISIHGIQDDGVLTKPRDTGRFCLIGSRRSNGASRTSLITKLLRAITVVDGTLKPNDARDWTIKNAAA